MGILLNQRGIGNLSPVVIFVIGVLMGGSIASLLLSSTPTYEPRRRPAITLQALITACNSDSNEEDSNSIKGAGDLQSNSPFYRIDSQVADDLEAKVRIFCWVATHQKNHEKRAKIVKETWGSRCSHLLFLSDADDESLNAINLDGVPAGYDHLTAKTMVGFDYVFKTYGDDYDWFLKADDDTFVIMENLRHLLFPYSPTEARSFGNHFHGELPKGFNSGGAGYIVSRGALELFTQRDPNLCAQDGGAEDVQFAKCLHHLGVEIGDSHDPAGGTRFHPFEPEKHLSKTGMPGWFNNYDADKGRGNISDFPISFHYVPIKQMHLLYHFVYHVRPFGLTHQVLLPQT